MSKSYKATAETSHYLHKIRYGCKEISKINCSCGNSHRQHVDKEKAAHFDRLDSFLEFFHVADMREGGCRNGQVQEVTERLPALLHVEDQEPILWHGPDDLLVPALVKL